MRGVGGERDNAKRILKQLMEKYDLTEEDLQDAPKTKRYEFRYKSKWEKDILVQCYCRVLNVGSMRYSQRGRGRLVMELDFFQFLELDAIYTHHVTLYKQELELFSVAFITKHRLVSDTGGGECKLSPGEFDQLMRMMGSMKEGGYVSPRRQLEEKDL